MAAQLPDEEKIKAANYVIDNSGALERTPSRCGRSGRTANPSLRRPRNELVLAAKPKQTLIARTTRAGPSLIV